MGRQYSAGPQASRLAWYDRNPSISVQNYANSGVAPHALTVRWSYTVPAGKKAFVETISARLVRDAAATTAGLASIYVAVLPYGGSWTPLLRIAVLSNGVGDRDGGEIGQSVILKAGDGLRAETYDTSTGGTLFYSVSAKITEFDA